MISLNEYVLKLSTGETLRVSELVLSVLSVSPEAMREFDKIRHLCTQASHEEMEEAKAGYDRALLKLMRSSPTGCLQKSPSPVCALIRSCSMAKPPECTTRNVGRSKGKFPTCWTWDSPEPASSELVDAVIHAWRDGRHVIVVP